MGRPHCLLRVRVYDVPKETSAQGNTRTRRPCPKRKIPYRPLRHERTYVSMWMCDSNRENSPVPYTDILSSARRNVNAIRVLLFYPAYFAAGFHLHLSTSCSRSITSENKRLSLEKVSLWLHVQTCFISKKNFLTPRKINRFDRLVWSNISGAKWKSNLFYLISFEPFVDYIVRIFILSSYEKVLVLCEKWLLMKFFN